ncbi:uncharacterized protein [Littorina saxatilis]|uniref:uncharacterized protein n=1 Tax=Littorina saxatilis TaxID=31220 RepID=UPI0038B61BB8
MNKDASCDNDDGDSGVGRGIAADPSGKTSERVDTHGTVTALTTPQSHSRQNTGIIQSSQRSGEDIVPATPTNPGNYSNLGEDRTKWTTSSYTPFSKRVHLSEDDKDSVKTCRTEPPRPAQAGHPGVSDVYEIVEESATKIKRGASGRDSDAVYEDPDKPARRGPVEVMRLPERVPHKGKKMPCERDDDAGAIYQNTPPQRCRSDVGYSNANHAYSNDDDRNSAAPNGGTDDVYIEVADGRPSTDSMYMNRD